MLNSRNVLNLKVSLLITARLLLNAMKSTMAYRWGVAAAEPGAAAAAAKADAAKASLPLMVAADPGGSGRKDSAHLPGGTTSIGGRKKKWPGIEFQCVHLKGHAGTSLVVQWLRLRASSAGDTSSVPGQGTKTEHTLWPN